MDLKGLLSILKDCKGSFSKENFYFYFFVVIGIITVIYATLTQSAWYDESLSLLFSSWRINEIFQLTKSSDLQQPLYYIFLHYFGKTIISARIWSLFFYIFSGVFLYKYIIKNKIVSSKNIFLISLFFISPFMIYYASEARPYMLLVFLTLGNLYYFENIVSTKDLGSEDKLTNVIFFSIFSLLGVYTFYLFVFLLIAQFLYIVFLKRGKFLNFFWGWIIIGIGYLPWIIVVVANRLGEEPSHFLKIPWWQIPIIVLIGFGGGRVTITDVNHIKEYWPTFLVLVVYLLSFVGIVHYYIDAVKKKKELVIRNIFIIGIVLIISLIVSATKVSLFDPRYHIYMFPLFIIIIMGISDYLLNMDKKIGFIILSLLLFSNLTILSLYLFNPWYQREPWKNVVPKIESELKIGDSVTFYEPTIVSAYQLYQTKPIHYVSVFDTNKLEEIDKELGQSSRVWFSLFLEKQRDPTSKVRDYLDTKFKYIKTIGFFKVKFDLYEKK